MHVGGFGLGVVRGDRVVGQEVLGVVEGSAGDVVAVQRVGDVHVVADLRRPGVVVHHVDVVDADVGVVEAVLGVEAVVDDVRPVVGVHATVVGVLTTVASSLGAVAERDLVVGDVDVADRRLV